MIPDKFDTILKDLEERLDRAKQLSRRGIHLRGDDLNGFLDGVIDALKELRVIAGETRRKRQQGGLGEGSERVHEDIPDVVHGE